ncbi:MAG: beta-N-acetylglucosaminidase domain-containing protein [Betaproteobacteria bacterium]|nr:beta-N-acetylglucosaminidase domain-containing protein [Betaproteobacteria bacterium]
MRHRRAVFRFGAKRGMNTYLYAPKDDPYHRERWREPYSKGEWRPLLGLIRAAQDQRIDFVYGFHPGKGLRFSAPEPVQLLLEKTQRFYDAGVRTFAVLFDDIPSRLAHEEDRKRFNDSLARAEALWLEKILERQPASWKKVEWWICPSRYTDHPQLARMFGAFEPRFWETLARHLPHSVACLWTGPAIVPRKISLTHARNAARQMRHPLILWDNYPVNDLSMSDEMHLAPLVGRDSRLPEVVYGYLNNPLMQESLSLLPLATCFDYAADPAAYDPERSWTEAARELFGRSAIPHWRAILDFCEQMNRSKRSKRSAALAPGRLRALQDVHRYLLRNQGRRWFEEFRAWIVRLEADLAQR